MKHVNVALFVVHIGCPHRCSFCDQRSITRVAHKVTPEDVHSAVETALASLDGETASEGEIAFFGGSFTMIDREYMMSLLDAAYSYVKNGVFRGIRISTRPDGITEEICEILKSRGVTSVELGAQSLDDRVLKLNERGHTAKQVEDACRMLESHGFETGLQMMTGLYGSSDEDSIETARKIIALSPATVRIYPTVVIEGTKLYELMRSGEFVPKGIEETVDLCAKLIPMFENAGIKVIRVGLHSDGDTSKFAAGAFHPALRELCEGRIYRDAALRELNNMTPGKYILSVGPGQRSKMTGQKKANLSFLRDRGYDCEVAQEEGLTKYEIKVRKKDAS
ncbi:MAG: radical SAM protein [Clostridia bacterium]|nr:radical SAM protein [Clostridia bacterium]